MKYSTVLLSVFEKKRFTHVSKQISIRDYKIWYSTFNILCKFLCSIQLRKHLLGTHMCQELCGI